VFFQVGDGGRELEFNGQTKGFFKELNGLRGWHSLS
jgi:hypothetical protein